MVSDSSSLIASSATDISEDNKSRPSSESIEDIVLPSLDLLVGPDLSLLSVVDRCSKELVNISLGVIARGPQSLTIRGVSTTMEALLGTVVNDGDTLCKESPGKCVLVLPGIRLDVKESELVMIVHKASERVNILEILAVILKVVPEASHGLAVSKHVASGEEQRVRKNAVERPLEAGDVVDTAVISLAHAERPESALHFSPEVLRNFGDSIHANTVADGDHSGEKGVDESLTDVWVALVEVGEAGKTAVLNLGIVHVVGNVAVAGAPVAVVVVLGLVEGIDAAVVETDGASVVSNDVDHKVHPTAVECGLKALEVGLCAKLVVVGIEVLGPVAVIPVLGVGDHGADPNGVETHPLDVVEVALDTLPGTSAVLFEVAGGLAPVTRGETVGEDLVDGAGLPFLHAGAKSGGAEESKSEKRAHVSNKE